MMAQMFDYFPYIAAGVVVLIGLGVLLFTSYWTAVPFISLMASWIREDISDWARRLWRRLTGRG